MGVLALLFELLLKSIHLWTGDQILLIVATRTLL